MNKPYVLSIAGALAVGGALTGMGVLLAEDEDAAQIVVASSAAEDPEAEAGAVQVVDYDNIPGMAMGAPPESASMNCQTKKSCDLVFIPPTNATVEPFGWSVKLVKASAKRATISVDGKKYVVVAGKATTMRGGTAKLLGAPGTVVTVQLRRA